MARLASCDQWNDRCTSIVGARQELPAVGSAGVSPNGTPDLLLARSRSERKAPAFEEMRR
jgi:hypothetical protein